MNKIKRDQSEGKKLKKSKLGFSKNQGKSILVKKSQKNKQIEKQKIKIDDTSHQKDKENQSFVGYQIPFFDKISKSKVSNGKSRSKSMLTSAIRKNSSSKIFKSTVRQYVNQTGYKLQQENTNVSGQINSIRIDKIDQHSNEGQKQQFFTTNASYRHSAMTRSGMKFNSNLTMITDDPLFEQNVILRRQNKELQAKCQDLKAQNDQNIQANIKAEAQNLILKKQIQEFKDTQYKNTTQTVKHNLQLQNINKSKHERLQKIISKLKAQIVQQNLLNYNMQAQTNQISQEKTSLNIKNQQLIKKNQQQLKKRVELLATNKISKQKIQMLSMQLKGFQVGIQQFKEIKKSYEDRLTILQQEKKKIKQNASCVLELLKEYQIQEDD